MGWFAALNTVICVQMMHCAVCPLIQYIVIYLCSAFEENSMFCFPTRKGSMNTCMELMGSALPIRLTTTALVLVD